MKRIPPIVLLAAAGHAQGITPPQTPAPTTAAQPPAPQRFPGVSDAGNAILAKAQGTPDPQLQALARQARASHDQLVSAVMAPVIDVDKVTGIIRQEEALQGQIRAHSNDRLLTVLKQLPDEDRGTFLRTLLLSRARPANGAAPLAPPPPKP